MRVQHLGQLAARDRAVHAEIIGRDAPDRRKRRLAPGPEYQALLFRIRGAQGRRAALRCAISLTLLDQVVDFGLGAIEFDDQQRLDIERIAGMDEILRRVDGRPVHHFHAAGNDAGADDLGDAFARRLRSWESRPAGRAPSRASAECAPSLR